MEMIDNDNDDKKNILRFKNFKDIDNWSIKNDKYFNFPTYNYKHENTPLLNFLHTHGFNVHITHLSNEPRVKRYPNEEGWNCFHVEIDKMLTDENIREYIEENEIINNEDDYKRFYNDYKLHLGDSMLKTDPIEFHIFLPIKPNQVENSLFKEQCLISAKKELEHMLKANIVEKLSDYWNYDERIQDQKALIDFMSIHNINVRNNSQIPRVFDTNERLYLNSKVLATIKENELTIILKEFMSL